MDDAFRRSESPVFDVIADDDDFSLNLNEHIATIDDSMMDDVEVIENSDSELNNTVEHTMSMLSSFPMLSLVDDSRCISSEADMQNMHMLCTLPGRKPRSNRRGRPPKEMHCKKPIKKTKNLIFTSDSVIKKEGRKCKLNGSWYRVDARDINVIEAIENTLKEISRKLRKRPNVRILSLELHHVEEVLEVLQDNRLEFRGMTEEAWKEIYLMTKHKFSEVQEKLEELKHATVPRTELPRSPRSLEKKKQAVRSNGITALVHHPAKGIAETAVNNCSQDAIFEADNQITEAFNECDRNPLPQWAAGEIEATHVSEISEEISFANSLMADTQEIFFTEDEINEVEQLPADDVTQLTVGAGEINLSSSPSVQIFNSTDNRHKSKASSKNKGKSLRKQINPHPAKIKEIEEAKRRVNIYSILTKFNFDFKSLVARRLLIPRNIVIMSLHGESYRAHLREDGTLQTENKEYFPNLGKWLHSIAGKPFSRFSVEDKRTLRLVYADSPLEEVLASMELEPSSSVTVLSPVIEENFAPQPHEGLRLVPDEMMRHVKSMMLHTEAEYFPACKCYDKSWAGEEPFPQQYLDELENW